MTMKFRIVTNIDVTLKRFDTQDSPSRTLRDCDFGERFGRGCVCNENAFIIFQ